MFIKLIDLLKKILNLIISFLSAKLKGFMMKYELFKKLNNKDIFISKNDLLDTDKDIKETITENPLVQDDNFIKIEKDVFESIVSSIENLIELNNFLMECSLKTGELNDSISRDVSSMSENIAGESHNIEDIFGKMSEISIHLSETVDNTNAVKTSTMETFKVVENGNSTVKMLINQSEVVQLTINELLSFVKELIEKNKQIQEMAGMIKKISDTTNLLSLNAAIEAARVGEHGKGFSVIAQEVRDLSEKTALQSKEIDNLVNNNNNKILHLYEKVQQSSKDIDKTKDFVDQTSSVFAQILSLTSNINEKIEDTATSTEGNSTATKEILEFLNTVTENSKNNSEKLNNLCTLSLDQTSTIIEYVALCQQIGEFTKDIKNQIEPYK